ncbi:type VI secretion system contractile sheath small subunit, partial [Salmonella enterica]|uniref:type VI secretion system contractile sheath small subunit n=1 Tax=Salmonella enterica TaxID=28901 RepID=UPI000ABC38EE
NYDLVLSEFSPALHLAVVDALAVDAREHNVRLTFRQVQDFHPAQVARQIPQMKAMLAMRKLRLDLKSNLLDNATSRRELETILKDPARSDGLRAEQASLAPKHA